MADLADLLDANLSRGLRDPDTPGFSHRELLSELAELLSGSSERSGRAYLSQRRQAERWFPSPAQRRRGVRARTPTASSQRKLAAARRQQTRRIRQFRRNGADMRLYVSWYATRAPEWLPPHGWVEIPPSPIRTVIGLWARVDLEEAADELLRAFLRHYDVPNPLDWLQDLEILELELEPAR